ncbi:MAG: hypothetical protein ABI813_00360 [Bacteroidota bacterium]
MNYRLKLILVILVTSVYIFSCSKHNDDSTPPASQPPQPDTLGAGWQRVLVDSTLNFVDGFFVNSQTGFFCGENYLSKSTDGGLSWQKIILDSLNQVFINFFFWMPIMAG